MNKNRIAIESLSMDLYRIAIGYNQGSNRMAERFKEEALKRCSEIKTSEVKPYFLRILEKIQSALSKPYEDRTAEDALMYSTLCKNYARKYLS